MQLVFNWHITEACNYSCCYCFARWGRPREIWKNSTVCDRLFTELSKFSSLDSCKKIFEDRSVSNIRINFVGGEPLLLGESLITIIDRVVCEFGFSASIVTNASLLEGCLDILENIETIGISIDSFATDTNRLIGRAACCKDVLSGKDYKRIINLVRNRNPEIKVKVTSVVSEHNCGEELLKDIDALAPDRVKVFRQLPFEGNKGITDEMFDSFIVNNVI
ncbi:viperin family antiviral radical SAM protein [Maridesulfovibrio ferrireducens]|uniref:viperin family antiviral radical SAM protein n=1 Tax=Maridesulfovibrio ferrireducens TaxID=246191 RepID=UPI001A234E70|nr:viperin family antiviral radical SAM protein [Maridesulfovibrio ferrireducens]MBI9109570.1 4Fe-4S cluster-binding domain-containing protein [Maridesulfovibrio ferrireducens]